MKTITRALIFFIQTVFVSAFSELAFPDDRMLVSRVSDHILLIEVTSSTTETKEQDGLKATTYNISGKVIEAIRGERPENWSHTTTDIEVTNMDEAKKKLGHEAAMLISLGREFKREGSQCVSGEKYLVMYWRSFAFFVHVPKDDTKWRSEIRPREAPNEEEARQVAPRNR